MTALPPSGSFCMVDPVHVAAVGPAAAILFSRILWRSGEAGEWRATRGELAAETGLSLPMIRTAADLLREQGWVQTRRTSTMDATLIWTPVLAGQVQIAESAISGMRNPQSGDSAIRQTPLAESAISSLETGRDIPPTPADAEGLFGTPPESIPAPAPLRAVPSAAGLDAEFVRFWDLYPRKTGKKAARQAYGRARRDATVEQIAAGLRRQLPALQARVAAGEAQFVPHPTTWLNQGRWDDEQDAGPRNVNGDTSYDPAYAAALPPPRTDPFAPRVAL